MPSHLEQRFLANVKMKRLADGLRREYKFHPKRRWRLDFAWPEIKLAVEIQGGVHSRKRSGHTTGAGVQRDYDKNNAAVLLGWRVLFFSSRDLHYKTLPRTMGVVQAVILGLRNGEELTEASLYS
jgi:very-short-patch-repair endonuclease